MSISRFLLILLRRRLSGRELHTECRIFVIGTPSGYQKRLVNTRYRHSFCPSNNATMSQTNTCVIGKFAEEVVTDVSLTRKYQNFAKILCELTL